jgi:hypothetical protein
MLYVKDLPNLLNFIEIGEYYLNIIVKKSLLIGLAFLLVSISAYSYINQKKIAEANKMKLESVVGSSLFIVWEKYKSMEEIGELDNEKIEIINTNLHIIRAHSAVIDRAVGTTLLRPIADKMIIKFDSISLGYKQSGIFTDKDQEDYTDFINKSLELTDLFSVYYRSTDTHSEGSKIKLNISDYGKLVDFRRNF